MVHTLLQYCIMFTAWRVSVVHPLLQYTSCSLLELENSFLTESKSSLLGGYAKTCTPFCVTVQFVLEPESHCIVMAGLELII